MNRVFLIGHIGKDPELKPTAGGTSVLKFSLATKERYNDQEHTEWHNIVAFGKRAEFMAKYLSKGDRVHIEGRLKTSKYEDRDGNTRYSTSIVVGEIIFLTLRNTPDKKRAPEDDREPIDDGDVPF